MLVKTLRPHGNQYGDAYQKRKGVIYDHPRPQAEISAKIVKEHKVREKAKAAGADQPEVSVNDGPAVG